MMALDCFLVLAAFVGVAGVQSVARPFQHFIVEVKPPEQFSKLRFKRFLTNILTAARCRVALASIGITGAMIIDVALLLSLALSTTSSPMAGASAF